MPISRRRPSTSTTPDAGGNATVWAAGADAEAVVLAYPAIDAALKRRPGCRLVITVPDGDLAALRRRLPHETVVVQPDPARQRRWLRRIAPCLRIRIGGIAGGDIAVPDLGFAGPGDVTVEAILAALPLPAPPRSPARGRLRGAVLRLLAGAPLAGLEALRERLGRPDSILCLGNGPSSEDPALAGVAFDRLFRVNWIWRERGRFDRPDVVFTADPDLPPPGLRPLLCLPEAAAGAAILLRHFAARRGPPGYLFLDRLPEFAGELARPPIPTNGALMISVAAALRPQRLVIAGVDLYAHPAGRYPGDAAALDGYGRLHDRDGDLAVIRRALDSYGGEVTIFGETLKAALQRG